MNDLHSALAERAGDRGITMAQLAELIGMSRSGMYAKLAGGPEFTLAEAAAIADELGTSIDEVHAMAKAKASA